MPRKATGKPTGRPKKTLDPGSAPAPLAPVEFTAAAPPAAPPAGTLEAVQNVLDRMGVEASKASPNAAKGRMLADELATQEKLLTRADAIAKDARRIALIEAQKEVAALSAANLILVGENTALQTETAALKSEVAEFRLWRQSVTDTVAIAKADKEAAERYEARIAAEKRQAEEAAAKRDAAAQKLIPLEAELSVKEKQTDDEFLAAWRETDEGRGPGGELPPWSPEYNVAFRDRQRDKVYLREKIAKLKKVVAGEDPEPEPPVPAPAVSRW
jgi:hypothetical protein